MDDKTTKIPSLKEFQKAQQEQERRTRVRRTGNAPVKHKSLKGDTHRVKLGHNNKKSVPESDVKIRPERTKSVKSVSASTQKINTKAVLEQDDRFKAFESDVSYNRRPTQQKSKPLTQTRVAGQRPAGERPVNTSSSVRPPQQRQNVNRPMPQNNMKRPVNNASGNMHRKKKKKPLSPFHRKVRRVLVYALIVLGILTVGVILSMTVLFKTEKIVVNVPDNFYSSQDIIDASGLHYEDNIFMAGKNRAESRLEEKFPYIKEAKVTAVIPDTINIDIVLGTPSFAVKTDKLTYIADEDSKVLDVVATADEVEVALIEGVSVKDAKAGEKLEFESAIVKDSLTEMFGLAKEKGYKKITAVDIETNTANSGAQTLEIRYVYDERIVVFIGIPENITYKMQTAQTIIDEKLDVNGAVLTGELDVSNAYDTKKSYFNQYSLIPQVVITEPATEATEAPDEEPQDEYYDEEYEDEEFYW
ncbi:MAG: FtsQ-type POTRA domain-containing protein [Clostridia bacterium]|nr:FtsQ-type POTRA domain-containing protein [Clostridia bacterium]